MGAISRTIILALALLNQILTVAGYSPIPVDDETITDLIALIVTVVAALVAWWKNNSFTVPAKLADKYLNDLRRNSNG